MDLEAIKSLIDNRFRLEQDRITKSIIISIKKSAEDLAQKGLYRSGIAVNRFVDIYCSGAEDLIKARLDIEKEIRLQAKIAFSDEEHTTLITKLNSIIDSQERMCSDRVNQLDVHYIHWHMPFRLLKNKVPIYVDMLRGEFELAGGESVSEIAITTNPPSWDYFISHATEDKDSIARELAEELTNEGFKVWYDEFTLTAGDSLRASIDQGLANSRFGIVILSQNFFNKNWPQTELNGLFTKERPGQKVILPVWHNVTKEEIMQYSPILADRLGISSSKGIPQIVEDLKRASDISSEIISFYNANGSTSPATADFPIIRNMFYEECLQQISLGGWKEGEGYRQALIYPTVSTDIPLNAINDLIETCTVKTDGWGGPDYPYNQDFPSSNVTRHNNGIALIDNNPRIDSDWTFYYWNMTRSLLFLHRASMTEDHESGIPEKTMEITWLYMDVIRPIKFASNILFYLDDIKDVTIDIEWGGMNNRRLVDLDRRKVGFLRDYICHEDKIKVSVTINKETDLLACCYKVIADLLWLFGWDKYQEDAVKSKLQTLLNNRFPE